MYGKKQKIFVDHGDKKLLSFSEILEPAADVLIFDGNELTHYEFFSDKKCNNSYGRMFKNFIALNFIQMLIYTFHLLTVKSFD